MEYLPTVRTESIRVPYVETSACPPAAIRDLRDPLNGKYAKILADSAGVGKRNYGPFTQRFVKLRHGDIAWDTIREYLKRRDDDRRYPCRRA